MISKSDQITITKYDLMYEQRMTRVESTLEHLAKDAKEIKSDLRWILGLMIALLGVMAKGFHWF